MCEALGSIQGTKTHLQLLPIRAEQANETIQAYMTDYTGSVQTYDSDNFFYLKYKKIKFQNMLSEVL